MKFITNNSLKVSFDKQNPFISTMPSLNAKNLQKNFMVVLMISKIVYKSISNQFLLQNYIELLAR